MKKWHTTLTEAKKALKAHKEQSHQDMRIFKWMHTKRKKPYFVGTYLDWLQY